MKLKQILTVTAAAALLSTQAVCMTVSFPAYAAAIDPNDFEVCDGVLEEFRGSYTETLVVPAEIGGEKIIGVSQYAYPQTVSPF